MKNTRVTINEIVAAGVSKQRVYRLIRTKTLTFKNGAADPVKLLAEWRKKADPTRDDKIGPALEGIIRGCGLTVPADGNVPSGRSEAIVEAPPDASGAPGHLSPAMKKFWKQIMSEFDLTDDARLLLRTAAEAWDRAQSAREAIARDGLVINSRRHPCVDIEAQSQSLFLRAMRQLGLDVVPSGPIGRPGGR
jgi:hypothetical protein